MIIMVNDMSKRRVSKVSKRRLRVFAPICLIAIFYSLFSLLYNGYTIYELSVEKQKLEKRLISLQEESENLKTDIEKLNDEEYLANYAREHYMYSKDGEYIIHIEEDETEIANSINTLGEQIDRNYVVIFLSVVVILITFYIYRKSKKK